MLKERRIFRRRQVLSLLMKLRALHIKRRIMHGILLEEEVAEEEDEGRILEVGGQTLPKRMV